MIFYVFSVVFTEKENKGCISISSFDIFGVFL